MAVITPYTERVNPQGQVGGQASPNAFGAQVGSALQNIGGSMMGYAETLYRNEAEADVTNVHVEMAKKRAEWQQKLNQMANETKPGDDTFMQRVMTGIQGDFDAFGQSVKTRAGEQTFARMAANMTSMFGQEAAGIQSRLDGEFAKNQYVTMSKSLGTVAAQDHTQWKSLVDQGLNAINDPNGRFARIPEPTREAFRRSIEEEIKYDAAKGFARRFPNAVLGTTPTELRQSLQQVVAQQPRPGLPPNLNAPLVKPYDETNIESRARKVDAPSEFDGFFMQAGALYNLDWRELKMRAVVESNLNPKASSGQAYGIMQLTPETAKRLGVQLPDANATEVPVNLTQASIFAAAKLISEYRTKANGDMSQVDMMYYGGEGGTAWGPNTKQYAANMAALRQRVGLGSAKPPEAFAPTQVAMAGDGQDWKKPTTGIDFIDSLPADKFFSILTEAEQYQRAYDTQSERARIEAERQKKKEQDAVMTGYLARVINPTQENGGALSETEIVQNNVLDWQQKQHMIDYSIRRTRELASMAEPKSNPAEVRRLLLDIHAADDDPVKSYNMDPVMESYRKGYISTPEMQMLRREVEQLRDGTTSGFQKQVQNARNAVNTALTRSIMGQAQPEVAADASYRFMMDMEQQIAAYRKENKDPRALLDPNAREYLLKPERIQSFMQGSSQALGDNATKAAGAEARTENREAVSGYSIGKIYTVNGKQMIYMGGPLNVRSSWQEAR